MYEMLYFWQIYDLHAFRSVMWQELLSSLDNTPGARLTKT